jgi:hypothetical protein
VFGAGALGGVVAGCSRPASGSRRLSVGSASHRLAEAAPLLQLLLPPGGCGGSSNATRAAHAKMQRNGDACDGRAALGGEAGRALKERTVAGAAVP